MPINNRLYQAIDDAPLVDAIETLAAWCDRWAEIEIEAGFAASAGAYKAAALDLRRVVDQVGAR